MPTPLRTQCLLFIAHKGKGRRKAKGTPLDRSKMDAYALLPHTLKRGIAALFADNGVKLIDSDKDYPSLFSAVRYNSVEICEILLDDGGDAHGVKFRPPGALHVAIDAGNRKLVKMLLPKKIIIHPLKNVDTACVQTALDDKNLKFMDVVLSHGTNIRFRHPSGTTLLHFAAGYSYEALVESLLKHGAKVNAKGRDGTTPLHLAAMNGHLQITEELLKHRANVNAAMTDSKMRGWTPLHAAISRRHLKVASCLLEKGANVNAAHGGGVVSLRWAVQNRCLKAIDLLLKHKPDLRNVFNKKAFFLSMMESYTYMEYKEMAEKLFNYGFTVEPEHASDVRILQGAVRANLLEIVRKLIQYGADVHCHAPCPGEEPLLHIAAEFASEDMVLLLLDNGASVEDTCSLERTPLFGAVRRGCLKNLQVLRKYGASVNCTDTFGLTPLHVACGAVICCTGIYGLTVSQGSSESDHSSIVEFLLENGANVDAKCKEGKTPLFYAVMQSNHSVIRSLFKFGAHFDFLDKIGSADFFSDIFKPNTLNAILEYYFFEPQLFGDIWRRYKSLATMANTPSSAQCTKILYNYGYKTTVANLQSYKGDALDFFKKPPVASMSDFKRQCEAEYERLKIELIEDTGLSYHEIMMGDPDRIACYLRNDRIVEILKSENYKTMFPLYAGILHGRILRANLRKALLRQGAKACCFLFHHFTKLPYNIKERILMYLSNEQIKILLYVCKLSHMILDKI